MGARFDTPQEGMWLESPFSATRNAHDLDDDEVSADLFQTFEGLKRLVEARLG